MQYQVRLTGDGIDGGGLIYAPRDEDGYISESVQTARSIGDADAKFPDGGASHSAAVVPTPEITVRDLTADDVALVLGCDGLFEGHGGSNAWINRMVRKLVKEGKAAKQIAAALASNTSLASLDMSHCNIELQGVQALANALALNSSLRTLRIHTSPPRWIAVRAQTR